MSTFSSQSTNQRYEISFQKAISTTALKKSYRIVLEKDEDGRVVVKCPDLQGVTTDGEDENEAIKNALEAIGAVLESRHLDKEYDLVVSHRPSV